MMSFQNSREFKLLFIYAKIPNDSAYTIYWTYLPPMKAETLDIVS